MDERDGLAYRRIADRWFGEKEILFLGFIVLALSSMAIGLLHNKSIIVWTSLLFVSRIGASMVEAMSETYFFKRVKDSDLGFISLFRTTKPWAYVVAPALAIVILPIAGLDASFIVLGFVMLYGVRFALALKDTK